MADARLQPIMNGVPSPLQYTAGASLPPGEYTLKLAIAEGARVGTVEHTIHAGLAEAGGVTMSELARRRVDPDPRVRWRVLASRVLKRHEAFLACAAETIKLTACAPQSVTSE